MIISDFRYKKVVDHLEQSKFGSAVFIFNHGLGDFVNFLPIYYELKKRYKRWNLHMACSDYRDFQSPHLSCFNIGKNPRILFRKYTCCFNLSYPEPPLGDSLCKPYYCNENIIGMKDFEWKQFVMFPNFSVDKRSKLVGFHFQGNSNADIKNVNSELAKMMVREVSNAGFVPYLCQNFNLNQMISKMKETRFFVGIESGPFYLSGTIIGYDNCIGLERNMLFQRYLPLQISKINVDYYQQGMLADLLKSKE